MKAVSVIAVASLAAIASASPVMNKREFVTAIKWEEITVTITGYPPVETPAPAEAETPAAPEATVSIDSSESDNRYGNWGGNWGNHGSNDYSAPAAAETSAAPAPAAPAASSAPAAAAPSAPASSAPANGAVSSDYAQGILDAHNNHRANHSAADLVWSDKMASIAQQIAAKCVYGHDTSTGGGGYGQNIGAGAPSSDIPAMITNQMYNGEINFYPGYGSEPSMSNFSKWGHFSQIVWKSTTSVGCYTQYCPNGLSGTGGGVSPYFTVCNYSPPGNFGGQYAANVLKPLGAATVTL